MRKCIVLITVKKMAIRRSKSEKGGGRGMVLEGCGVGTMWSAECDIGGKRAVGVCVCVRGRENEVEEEKERRERNRRKRRQGRGR